MLPPPPLDRRRTRVVAGAFGLLLVAGVAFVLAGDGDEAPLPDPEALMLARETALRHRLDLAKARRLHLVLEPANGTLTLFLGGASLRSFPVQEVETGTRRMPFGGGEDIPDWKSRVWESPRMEPPIERDRRVIVSDSVAPPDPTGAVDFVPPTPEEEVPSPSRFVAHFPGGLGLEFVAADDAPDSTGAEEAPAVEAIEADEDATPRHGILRRISDRALRLRPSNWDRYRIRIVMDAADVGALYRSFPDSSAFVAVLPER